MCLLWCFIHPRKKHATDHTFNESSATPAIEARSRFLAHRKNYYSGEILSLTFSREYQKEK
jgi:hypothetical protein